MNKLEQAALQALEALQKAEMVYAVRDVHPMAVKQVEEAITALRKALAEHQITTPDVCGEVCARAKLCYGCNKDLEEANAKFAEQEQEPVLMPVRRGTRITCMESDETCVVWTTSDTHAWVQFPDGQMGKYTYEQIGSYFSLDENYATDEAYERGLKEGIEAGKKIAQQAEQEPVAWMWACTECGTEAEDGTDGRICSSCGYHKFYKAPKDTAYVCEARAQEQPHPDDEAVDRFAAAMKAKLEKKRAEGRGGWEDKNQCSAEFLNRLLNEHVGKGDPVDVGNLAMMLWNRGEHTETKCNNCGRVTLAEQAEQEPVAWVWLDDWLNDGYPEDCFSRVNHQNKTPLYAEPVRTKDLTDDEIDECWNCSVPVRRWRVFARAVIEKFKEKNK